MRATLMKILAVVEVICLRFLLAPMVILVTNKLFPGFEAWQTQSLGFAFPVFGDVVLVGLSLTVTWIHRRKLSDYGISLANLNYHLRIAAACFIPVFLSSMPFGMGIQYKTWSGAVLLALVQIGLLLALAFLLRFKPSAPGTVYSFLPLVLATALHPPSAQPVNPISIFLTYALFVGFGEEIMYRGYMQSRLNAVFEKPFTFVGVRFGWGAMITAFLFGLSHVGIVSWVLGQTSGLTWAWGFWTFFGGLVFGYLREKTGSILAPALLHGLPQAIASVAVVWMA